MRRGSGLRILLEEGLEYFLITLLLLMAMVLADGGGGGGSRSGARHPRAYVNLEQSHIYSPIISSLHLIMY